MLPCPLLLSLLYFKIMRHIKTFFFFSASHMKIGYSCYRLNTQAFYVVLLLQFLMRMFLMCRLRDKYWFYVSALASCLCFMKYFTLISICQMLHQSLIQLRKYFMLFFIHTATLPSLAAMHVGRWIIDALNIIVMGYKCLIWVRVECGLSMRLLWRGHISII